MAYIVVRGGQPAVETDLNVHSALIAIETQQGARRATDLYLFDKETLFGRCSTQTLWFCREARQ